jgi:hypothetical protein
VAVQTGIRKREISFPLFDELPQNVLNRGIRRDVRAHFHLRDRPSSPTREDEEMELEPP